MEISINETKISGLELFKKIWTGWVIGISTVFIPLMILAGFTTDPELFNKNISPFTFAAIIPVIAGLQGVFFGTVILLGLKILSLIQNNS